MVTAKFDLDRGTGNQSHIKDPVMLAGALEPWLIYH